MNRDSHISRQASTSCTEDTCLNINERCIADEEPKRKSKTLFSVAKKDGVSFCEECDYITQKLCEAEQSILYKEHLVNLLQNQLENLKNWNIKSIDESQEIYFKYAVAKQELDKLKHICEKYENDLGKLRSHNPPKASEVAKLKEEAEKWKKQYEELAANMKIENSLAKQESSLKCMVSRPTDEEKWRSIIQDEVATAVNMLKENTQVVISSLEKQNKKLETMIEKLHEDLEVAAGREEQLQKELLSIKNFASPSTFTTKVSSVEITDDISPDITKLIEANKILQQELDEQNSLYNDLRKEYEEILRKNEDDIKKTNSLNEELSIAKEDYRALTRSLSGLSEEIAKARENALLKNEELREQVAEIAPSSDMTEFINEITNSLEKIELSCETKSEQDVSEQVVELSNSVADVEKINKLNSDIELKILEVKTSKIIDSLEQERNSLKDKLTKISDDLKKKSIESVEKMGSMQNELENNKELILKQSLNISSLHTALECEKKHCDDLKNEIKKIKHALKISLVELSEENDELKSELSATSSAAKSLEEENINIKASLNETKSLNKSLNFQLKEAMDTINEMKELMEDSQQRMQNFEKANEDFQLTIEVLKHEDISDKNKVEEYKNKISTLVAENNSQSQQIEIERETINSLKQHIDSLQFYHNNEMKSNSVKLDEALAENSITKNNLQAEIEKLSNTNKQLQDKLKRIETENNQLHHNILELNQEISLLGEKLQSTDILQDTQKYVEALDAVTKENQAMKAAMSILHEILETKLSENAESVTELIETERRKTNGQYEEFNINSSPMSADRSREHSLEQRVSNIKEKIDELVEDDAYEDDDKKCLSMPNLEEIPSEQNTGERSLPKSSLRNSRKATSSDNILTEDDTCCAVKWERQIQYIQQLRAELADILRKIEEQKKDTTSSTAIYYTKKYSQLVNNLESQVNQIKLTSTCQAHVSDNGCLYEMEQEMSKLRKELYKQKVERLLEILDMIYNYRTILEYIFTKEYS